MATVSEAIGLALPYSAGAPAPYEFRDRFCREQGLDLKVWINPEGKAQNINPFDHGSKTHTDVMKTAALKQALNHYQYDAAFGGARRDEEKSRAKERVYSFRDRLHQWDPKNQRPELWNLYNGKVNKGESIRAFPLSNWTELDVWQYVEAQGIEVSELYFAAPRPTLERDGTLLMVDDERLKPGPGETVEERWVRFRTLGCYPLSGAMESRAATVSELIDEMRAGRQSERQGRLIDRDGTASMERKKREGYF